jgi:hypothetical protein
METTYVLFGEDVVRVYYEQGVNAVKESNHHYEVVAFINPSVEDVLDEAMGWFGFHILTEEEFLILKKDLYENI